MAERKENVSFAFTVEGDTEKWYLDWLQQKINSCEQAAYRVSIDSKIEQSPLSNAKRINRLTTPKIFHLCDVESNNNEDIKKFQSILNELILAKKEKKVTYSLGYSNFSFELWMILHKQDCNTPLTHKKQYLDILNRAYSTHFSSLKQYKSKTEFDKCLNNLSLQDVKNAVRRADMLMAANKRDGKTSIQYKGFSYYTDNPALTIWESVQDILKSCELL